MNYRIVITPGEPAGIGPDLCIQLAQQPLPGIEPVVIADPDLMRERAQALGLPLTLAEYRPDQASSDDTDLVRDSLDRGSPGGLPPGYLRIVPVELARSCQPGQLDSRNSPYVLETLRRAATGSQEGHFHAMVTGPVHKGIINEGGIAFTGHTEFLAELCGCPLTVMMLATEGLRVALATTHLPLSQVASHIDAPLLREIIRILDQDLRSRFGIERPEILVCGLNPHAGEGGHLGREEIEIIEPVLTEARQAGIRVTGPLPADTLFTDKYLRHADAVLAMYHDQGLPVLKYRGFGQAVNITLGLPIIRTSVDHGTALDLAATGQASAGSLMTALRTAAEMAAHTSGSGR